MCKRKVAIACQGGGSHAAFAAGVLSGLLSGEDGDRFDRDCRLVALSGTSGGARLRLFGVVGPACEGRPR